MRPHEVDQRLRPHAAPVHGGHRPAGHAVEVGHLLDGRQRGQLGVGQLDRLLDLAADLEAVGRGIEHRHRRVDRVDAPAGRGRDLVHDRDRAGHARHRVRDGVEKREVSAMPPMPAASVPRKAARPSGMPRSESTPSRYRAAAASLRPGGAAFTLLFAASRVQRLGIPWVRDGSAARHQRPVARPRHRRDRVRHARRAGRRPRPHAARPRAAAGGLRPLAAAEDRAGHGRDPRRDAPRQDAGRADLADGRQPRPRQLGRGDERVGGLAGGARRGRRAALAQGERAAARPRRPGGRDEVRAGRRPQRAGARVGPRDLRAGGGRRDRARIC